MTNLLNNVNTNTVNLPEKGSSSAANALTAGKTKPFEYKGKLLPSKIFGSPAEYVKDLKKDVVNIGRAAKGEANDHELGRINDVALKLGSLALAGYLFVKNPFKLSKTMEFAGVGAFFASMALWPKIFIQAPLKARTGVDIHRKYIDSQGRKKMVHQDPQYDLTDLYPREELDNIGKKLKVNENLPDRDSFIKQRAKKVAVQGNTLWMMTAGVTPVMTALTCSALEKPIGKTLENADLAITARRLENAGRIGAVERFKQKHAVKAFESFLEKNADRAFDEKMIDQLSTGLTAGINDADFTGVVKKDMLNWGKDKLFNKEYLRKALLTVLPESAFSSLDETTAKKLEEALAANDFGVISKILSNGAAANKRQQVKLQRQIMGALEKAKENGQSFKLGDEYIAEKLKNLHEGLRYFGSQKNALDSYTIARVGDRTGSYIANQWERVSNAFVKSLHLSAGDIDKLIGGDISGLAERLNKLAAEGDSAEFDKIIKKLSGLIENYENVAGDEFTQTVKKGAKRICKSGYEDLRKSGFSEIADSVVSSAKKGTVENSIVRTASTRALGAKSSFYRILHTLDVFRSANNGQLEKRLINALESLELPADEESVKKLVEVCKKVVLDATTTDHIEKMTTSSYKLTKGEYKAVMKTLFADGAETNLSGLSDRIKAGLSNYKEQLLNKVINAQNDITPDLNARVVGEMKTNLNSLEKNNLTGKSIKNLVIDAYKKRSNSIKWLKLFGGIMAAVTAVTLIAGLTFGKKSKAEEEAEAQIKTNG